MSDRPVAILVGGVYGSGKSTLAGVLKDYVSVVDYDEIIGDLAGNGKFKDEASLNSRRTEAWGENFLAGIENSVLAGYPITVALGTFTTRERRDRYWDHLSQIAEVKGYYLMIPMRDSIQRIMDTRPPGDKLVNRNTVYDFYRAHNETFVRQKHDDLDVPDDVSPEYRALLRRSGYANSQMGRWTVLTQTLQPEVIIGSAYRQAALAGSLYFPLRHQTYGIE